MSLCDAFGVEAAVGAASSWGRKACNAISPAIDDTVPFPLSKRNLHKDTSIEKRYDGS